MGQKKSIKRGSKVVKIASSGSPLARRTVRLSGRKMSKDGGRERRFRTLMQGKRKKGGDSHSVRRNRKRGEGRYCDKEEKGATTNEIVPG